MKTWIFVSLEKCFFTSGNIEYAETIDNKNFRLWPTIQEAYDYVNAQEQILRKKGFRLVDSGNGSKESGIAFWCRHESADGRAVVYEVCVRIVSGELFCIH